VRIYAALFLVVTVPPAQADWSTRERVPGDGPGTTPIAITVQDYATAEVTLADDESIRLNVILTSDAGKPFTKSACPTVQVDRRLPLLFQPLGPECAVSSNKASILIGERTDRDVRSPMVYNLVNGTAIVIRYRTSDDHYAELAFPLRRSKQAVKAALGDYRIEPK
jgi:hypothetical protein